MGSASSVPMDVFVEAKAEYERLKHENPTLDDTEMFNKMNDFIAAKMPSHSLAAEAPAAEAPAAEAPAAEAPAVHEEAAPPAEAAPAAAEVPVEAA